MDICKRFLLVLFLLSSFSIAAQAQPELGRSRYLKSVSEARNKALTNTILPLITGIATTKISKNETLDTIGSTLAIYGLVMGPSGGNFYAEDYLRGGLGAVARAGAGYFLLLDATRELMGKEVAESMTWDNKDVELTDTRVMIGAGIFVGSMIYNVLSSKASVNGFNRSKGYQVHVSGKQIGSTMVPVVSAKFRF